MKKLGFGSGPERSRRDRSGSHVWAPSSTLQSLCASPRRCSAFRLCASSLFLLLVTACSGSTDVVGVLATDVETGALAGASESGEGSEGVSGVTELEGEGAPGEFSIVAGMPMSDWEGRPALDWPFNVSLREFFADGSWPGPFGPPPRVERQVIAVMGRQAKPENVSVVAAGPEVTERLRDVFARAQVDLEGEMVARVMRDRRSDEYRVALGPPGCAYSSIHHGGSCAEATADGFEHP